MDRNSLVALLTEAMTACARPTLQKLLASILQAAPVAALSQALQLAQSLGALSAGKTGRYNAPPAWILTGTVGFAEIADLISLEQVSRRWSYALRYTLTAAELATGREGTTSAASKMALRWLLLRAKRRPASIVQLSVGNQGIQWCQQRVDPRSRGPDESVRSFVLQGLCRLKNLTRLDLCGLVSELGSRRERGVPFQSLTLQEVTAALKKSECRLVAFHVNVDSFFWNVRSYLFIRDPLPVPDALIHLPPSVSDVKLISMHWGSMRLDGCVRALPGLCKLRLQIASIIQPSEWKALADLSDVCISLRLRCASQLRHAPASMEGVCDLSMGRVDFYTRIPREGTGDFGLEDTPFKAKVECFAASLRTLSLGGNEGPLLSPDTLRLARQLRSLSMTVLWQREGEEMWAALPDMAHLERLQVTGIPAGALWSHLDLLPRSLVWLEANMQPALPASDLFGDPLCLHKWVGERSAAQHPLPALRDVGLSVPEGVLDSDNFRARLWAALARVFPRARVSVVETHK